MWSSLFLLQQVTETPYLGILLSEDLGWSKHIAKTASKASSTLGFVRRNLKNCPIACRKTAIKIFKNIGNCSFVSAFIVPCYETGAISLDSFELVNVLSKIGAPYD
jgi:hypothetical protein